MENFTIDTKVGRLAIAVEDDKLCGVSLNSNSAVKSAESHYGKKVVKQLEQYFNDAHFSFDLALLQSGTEHQLKVWQALADIPVGKVLTYGELAKKVGSSARAIGNACRNNPIPIIVPCHRIVAAADIGGFSGAKKGKLLSIKRTLLNHEGHCY